MGLVTCRRKAVGEGSHVTGRASSEERDVTGSVTSPEGDVSVLASGEKVDVISPPVARDVIQDVTEGRDSHTADGSKVGRGWRVVRV